MRRPFFDALVRLWRTDRGFSALLGSLIAVIFVIPPLTSSGEAQSLLVQGLSQAFFTLIFVSGIVATSPSRSVFAAAAVVMGAAVVLFWVYYFVPDPTLGAWKAGSAALAAAFLTVLVVQQVFREGPITLQRIQGAVAVYLLLGLVWANVYVLIEQASPGAFRLPESSPNRAVLLPSLGYYSFVTLTTVGYGDIIPVHPAARSAAILEALVGQLFPAILIARLVAMELGARGASTPST